MNERAKQRSGISRIEALLVLAMIGLLASLFVPAFPLIREAARVQQCRSRLRHLGLALHSYHDRYQFLPTAATWGSEGLDLATLDSHEDPTPIQVTRQNWVQLILPDLAMAELALKFHTDLPIADDYNREARTVPVLGLCCPSDPYNRSNNFYRMPLPDQSSAEFARGNYAINGGSEFDPARAKSLSNPGPPHSHYEYDEEMRSFSFLGNGVTGINKSLSFKDFRNGLATLVVIDEVRAGLSPIDPRGVWSLGQIGGSITWGHGVSGDDGVPNATSTGADDIRNANALYVELGRDFIEGERMHACSYCDENVQATARSKHQGGVHVLTLDGAVHFVADEVDTTVWHVMHSRSTPAELLSGRLTDEIKGWNAKTGMSRPLSKPPFQSSNPTLPERLINSIQMEFVKVSAGEFVMGLEDAEIRVPYPSDAVPHQVRITQDFLLGTHEVTQGQYQQVISSNPSWHSAARSDEDLLGTSNTSNWPVENVSWDDAVEFCRRLSAMPEEQVARRAYRLPTEAEWEYACRAGRTNKIQKPTWDDALKSGEIGSNKPPKALVPGPVNAHAPNPFEIYGMCGSVFEWTADYRRRDAYANSPIDDPTGPPTGYLRVIRGWHWVATGTACRVYEASEPWFGNRFIGFRVVCVQN